jgi:hypothetical protein
VSSSVQRPRAWRCRSGVSRKSIVRTPASVHGSKAVGVACLESMNWVRVTGAGQVNSSHIGGCAPDRVIWLATLLRRGVRDGIIMDAYRTSTAESGSAVEGAVCTGWLTSSSWPAKQATACFICERLEATDPLLVLELRLLEGAVIGRSRICAGLVVEAYPERWDFLL